MPRVTVEVDKREKHQVSVHSRNHVTGNDSSAEPQTLNPGQKKSFDIPSEHHLVVSAGAEVGPAEEKD